MVRQCAALPQTYAPPHSAASSVMRVSPLAGEQRRAREPPRAAPRAERPPGRVGHTDAEQLALGALALLTVALGLVLLLAPVLAPPCFAARRVGTRLRLLLQHESTP